MDTKYMLGFDSFICEEKETSTKDAASLNIAHGIWTAIEQGHEFGIISALNPLQDEDTNRRSEKQLEDSIVASKLDYIRFQSGFKYEEDKGTEIQQTFFLVLGIPHAQLLIYAKKFAQDTFIQGSIHGITSYITQGPEKDMSLTHAEALLSWVTLLYSPGSFVTPHSIKAK